MESRDTTPLRRHEDPVVQIVLNTVPDPERMVHAIATSPYASEAKVQAIIAIGLAEAGLRSCEEANKIAEEAFQKPAHADLQILFLAGWYSMLLNLDQVPYDQLRAISGAMEALLSTNTPPEIRAVVRFMDGHTGGVQGDLRRKLRCISNILDDIPQESVYYEKFANLRAMGFLAHGRGFEVPDALSALDTGGYDQIGLFVCGLANFALTGRIGDFLDLLKEGHRLHIEKQIRKGARSLYESSCALATIICRKKNISSLTILDNALRNFPAWAKSTISLLECKPEEALYWARCHAEEDHTGEPLQFVGHTLVRAELAMGNARAARRLLQRLTEAGDETFGTEFYYARAERLLGNSCAAAQHFLTFRQTLSRYEAEPRFDFEIALASELSATDLLELQAAAESSTPVQVVSATKGEPREYVRHAIVSVGEALAQVKASVDRFAELDVPVLITGETGTGKELVARALHDASARSREPFIAINCGAVPEALIESELFGHARGAYTGAHASYRGIFRDAGRGTVFLDEIADISPRLQTALLRVLETREVRPVGSSTSYAMECRIIAATNRSLTTLAAEGTFRKDLLFRLKRLEIYLPPLRERMEDIATLAHYFVNLDRDTGEQAELSSALLERMRAHSWPGNVRELRNIIERMRILKSDKLRYDLDDWLPDLESPMSVESSSTKLPDTSQPQPAQPKRSKSTPTAISPEPTDITRFLTEGRTAFRRKDRLRELFQEVGKLKVSEAATILSVSRRTASRYMKELAEEGVIYKVTPTGSPQSHYYTIKAD